MTVRADLIRFFDILKIKEVSDNDREFSPVYISSVRVMLTKELGEILPRLETWARGVETTPNYPVDEVPIPMVLHCPRCGEQHIDEATEDWPNPPHRSHACQTPGCNTIWRPADVATAGVRSIPTTGKSDNWHP